MRSINIELLTYPEKIDLLASTDQIKTEFVHQNHLITRGRKRSWSMPSYTTGSSPGSFKNTIAGADSTPNLL